MGKNKNKNKNKSPLVALCLVKLWLQALSYTKLS
jgi:hypothetical protein